jgi:CheY-like chemotaxis protein
MGARVLVVDDSPTIRKVVATILRDHDYDPITAEDGQAALATLEQQEVDLVLLDFVMPRMNGFQFCRTLRASDRRDLPVILMSAKGDRIRGHFVRQTGAIDAITKPFDARGLLAVIEGALARLAETTQVDGKMTPSRPPTSAADESVSGARPNPFGASLASILAPSLRELGATAHVAEVIQRAATADIESALSTLFSERGQGAEALAGDLAVISIAEILQMLQIQRQSGALTATSRNRQVTVFVRQGNIDLATSRGLREEFLLGRYLVEDGAIGRQRLEAILADKSSSLPSGERLVLEGGVQPEAIDRALQRQTAELVYECVRWKRGRFSFVAGAGSSVAERARLGITVNSLIMEAFRRVDEWRLIEGSFNFDDVLYPDPAAIERSRNTADLTPREREVLARVDGERTVREIVDDIEGGSFELTKIIYQFLQSRLVHRAS